MPPLSSTKPMEWTRTWSKETKAQVKLICEVLRPSHIWDYDTRTWKRLRRPT